MKDWFWGVAVVGGFIAFMAFLILSTSATRDAWETKCIDAGGRPITIGHNTDAICVSEDWTLIPVKP